MPYLKLNTNLTIDNAQSPKLLSQLSQLVAQETGKPELYVMIELNADRWMLFAGSNDPLAYLECKSIGLSPQQAKALSARLSQLLETALRIPPDRIYIEFNNCPAELWGWNGSTFG
jgi:phenylpyruvate tautomerase